MKIIDFKKLMCSSKAVFIKLKITKVLKTFVSFVVKNMFV